MGHVEICDGLTNRRIRVPELSGTIRIDVGGPSPDIVVPPDTTVQRFSTATPAARHERRD